MAMNVSMTPAYTNLQSVSTASTQVTSTPSSTAVQSPAATSSSNVQATSDLTSPANDSSNTQVPVATFDAQAQLSEPAQSVTGNNLDVFA